MAIIVALATFLSVAVAGAEPVRLAITPFSVKAGPDLAYLNYGLIDLFSTRLALKDKVDVVSKDDVISAYGPPSPDPMARLINAGKKTHSTFILTGSLERSEKGFALNAYVIDMKTGKPVLETSEKSPANATDDVLMSLVDNTAAKINKQIFLRDTTPSADSKKPEAPGNVHAHPDSLIKTLKMKEK
jgi:TolB-like protein